MRFSGAARTARSASRRRSAPTARSSTATASPALWTRRRSRTSSPPWRRPAAAGRRRSRRASPPSASMRSRRRTAPIPTGTGTACPPPTRSSCTAPIPGFQTLPATASPTARPSRAASIRFCGTSPMRRSSPASPPPPRTGRSPRRRSPSRTPWSHGGSGTASPQTGRRTRPRISSTSGRSPSTVRARGSSSSTPPARRTPTDGGSAA